MSLFDRRAILWLPLAVAACGFTPVYGPGATGSRLQNNVEVLEPDTRDTFLLTRRLEERLGRAATPVYKLSLTVETEDENLAIDREGNISRLNLLGRADYALIEQETGRTVTSGSVDNFTSYSATGTTVATLAAQRDAQERLMTLLADQIFIRLTSADLS